MVYSSWGTDGPMVSRLGFGCLRFPKENLRDKDGIRKCVELVEYAVERGINYFDTAPTYANHLAESILGMAFEHCDVPVYVAAKSGLLIDRTAGDLLKRLDTSLRLMHRERIDFYHIWSVMSWEEYQEIIKHGGIYEGAVKARESGLIDYLCISLHCDVSDVLKIISDGRFDGITISMNVMNYEKWLPVLKAAKARKMGVATMNSLGGGSILSYGELFDGLDSSGDTVPVKALRFLTSFPEIDVVLSGMTSKEQIDENCSPFMESTTSYDVVNPPFRLNIKEKLCSGCNYCAPCTVGLPVSACMQAYNHKIFAESGEPDFSEQKAANSTFIRLRAEGAELVDFASCTACGECERRCTQGISIVERVAKMGNLAEKYGYTKQAISSRLSELDELCRSYRRIGIWPSCFYADKVLNYCQKSEFEERCVYFNSSPELWGKQFRGKAVHSLEEISDTGVEAIVIMNYRLQESIWEELREIVPSELKLIKLHRENDINWFEYND